MIAAAPHSSIRCRCSCTNLDPDGLTIWTIQEYSETRYSVTLPNTCGTWIGAVTPF